MADESKIELISFDTEISEGGGIELPSEELENLRKKGFKTVSVRISGTAGEAVRENGLDEELFDKIRTKQSLPDKVVFELLSAKGSIKDRKFGERTI